MAADRPIAPKEWRGRFFEDLEVGDVYGSRLGRTVTQTDNIWFTLLPLNANRVHFNEVFASGTRFGRPLVNSAHALALITGMSVPDASEDATANLAWTDIRLPNPVCEGAPLWAETEVLEKRGSRSRPSVGVVDVRTGGINERRGVVIEFRRTFLVYRSNASEVTDNFPGTDRPWSD